MLKMVLFAIIAIIVIFDHYYKFCDVFKVKFERKTIRNVPKPNVIVKIKKMDTQNSQISPLSYETFWLQNYFTCGVAMFLI
jgi:hypothetical protein